MSITKPILCCALVAIISTLTNFGAAAPPTERHRRHMNETNEPFARIVNGDFAKPGTWKHIVSLSMGCGGALISPQWVITAAHCLPSDGARLTVLYGTHYRSGQRGGHRCDVERTVKHPQYDGASVQYDVGLVKLACTVRVDDNTSIIPLATESTVDLRHARSQSVWVAGWGILEEGGSGPERLKYVRLNTFNSAECGRFLNESGPVHSSKLCARATAGQPAGQCFGDSGGPLVFHDGTRWMLVGVVSWHMNGCGQPNTINGYSYIPETIAWIRNQTGIDTSDHELSGLTCAHTKRLFNHNGADMNIDLAECARRCAGRPTCGAVSWLSSTDNDVWRSFGQKHNAQQTCFYYQTGEYTVQDDSMFTSCY